MRRNEIIALSAAVTVFAAVLASLILANVINTAQTIEITLLFVLVLVTTIYAKRTSDIADATKKQAQEMKEQRYAALKPIIDIQETSTPEDDIKIGSVIQNGELPQTLRCRLSSIGPGPAIDVYSFIQGPNGQSFRRDFSTMVANSEETVRPIAYLLLERKGEQGFSTVYYKDVYEQCFKSSREVKIKGGDLDIGPLIIHKLLKEEGNR